MATIFPPRTAKASPNVNCGSTVTTFAWWKMASGGASAAAADQPAGKTKIVKPRGTSAGNFLNMGGDFGRERPGFPPRFQSSGIADFVGATASRCAACAIAASSFAFQRELKLVAGAALVKSWNCAGER